MSSMSLSRSDVECGEDQTILSAKGVPNQEALYIETLHGFVGCISDDLTPTTLTKACHILEVSMHSTEAKSPSYDSFVEHQSDEEHRLGRLSLSAARELCALGSNPTLKKKQSWNALQDFSNRLQVPPLEDSNVLAISLLFGALGLLGCEDEVAPSAKAAASAMSSTVSRNKALRKEGRALVHGVLRSYLTHACHSDALNLNILTHFARAFKLSEEDEPVQGTLVARVVEQALDLASENGPYDLGGENIETNTESRKQRVSGALALVCQVRPWSDISPIKLVEAALPYDYWHAAELVCQLASKCASTPSQETAAVEAVEYLIDSSFDATLFRKGDTLATNLYHQGGKSRFLLARYLHACDTITKIISKRQLPIIERQVERIDKAFERVLADGVLSPDDDTIVGHDGISFSPHDDIRSFAIDRLEEEGEIGAIQRLAELWGIEYAHDPEAIAAAAAARKRKYLQFEQVLPGPVPDVISDPQTLRDDFGNFWQNGPFSEGPFGLDAEWGEESTGADLLQLSHPKKALLVDVRAIGATEEGTDALRDTVGALMECPKSIVAGFACRQDFQRLRGTPCAGKDHWLHATHSVVDIQKMVVDKEPKLAQRAGLSRVCQHYFGKPLDKSEQCSFWAARPLSERQRCYAALDAWVCAGVYEKIVE